MHIDLSGPNGAWEIKYGMVYLLEVQGSPFVDPIKARLKPQFPATDRGFRDYLNHIQTSIAVAVYNGRESEPPEDQMYLDMAQIEREKYKFVTGIQAAWIAANAVSLEDGSNLRRFAFRDQNETFVPNFRYWGIPDVDSRGPVQALGK